MVDGAAAHRQKDQRLGYGQGRDLAGDGADGIADDHGVGASLSGLHVGQRQR